MFKKCTFCQTEWEAFLHFAADKSLEFIGYQANFTKPGEGLFLFNHLQSSCKTTLAVNVTNFKEPLGHNQKLDAFTPHGPGCPGFCADKDNLKDCGNTQCNGHAVREMIQKLKEKLPKE